MDLLIGGAGSDSLVGGSGADLLIAGSTNFDHDFAALNAIMAEWTSANSYADRLKHLLGTTPGGMNGSTVLKPGVTVHDDGAPDTLGGGSGQDWFLARVPGDKVKDQVTGGPMAETVTPL
jgi:Ca2+-binding RTX toxin-like protein